MDVKALLNSGQEAAAAASQRKEQTTTTLRGGSFDGALWSTSTPPPASSFSHHHQHRHPPSLPPLHSHLARPQLHRQQYHHQLPFQRPQPPSPDTPVLSRSGSADSANFPSSPATPESAAADPTHSRSAAARGPRKMTTPQIISTSSLMTSPSGQQPQQPDMDAYPISPELTSPAQAPFYRQGFPPQTPFDAQLPPQAMPPHHTQQPQQQQSMPPTPQAYTGPGLPKVPQKKNSYPCPVAKQYNCSDYFTTSGHAARHAKKHTGKKDAICPECSKAFTRKDNMEQHRRTHSGGRGQAKSSSSSAAVEESKAKKVKLNHKKPKPTPLTTIAPEPSNNMEMAMLDPALRDGSMSAGHYEDPNGGLTYPSPMPSMQPPMHLPQYPEQMRHTQHWSFGSPRSSVSTSVSNNGFELQSPSLAPALDALALAASRQ